MGLTEYQLRERRIPDEIGHTSFKSLARAQMTDEKMGMLKILFHAESLRILGVHCFGDGAAEIAHIGQTVMASNDINSLRYFVNNTFNYPTMAEAYRLAAHNGLNRLAWRPESAPTVPSVLPAGKSNCAPPAQSCVWGRAWSMAAPPGWGPGSGRS